VEGLEVFPDAEVSASESWCGGAGCRGIGETVEDVRGLVSMSPGLTRHSPAAVWSSCHDLYRSNGKKKAMSKTST